MNRDRPGVGGESLSIGLVTPFSRGVFMAFAHAQPDTWETKLLQAEFRRLARAEGRRWTPPTEMDMLLHVLESAYLISAPIGSLNGGQCLSPSDSTALATR